MAIPLLHPDDQPPDQPPAGITAFAIIIDADGNAQAIGPDPKMAAEMGISLTQALAMAVASFEIRRPPQLVDMRRAAQEVADLAYAQIIDNIVVNGAQNRAQQAFAAQQLAAISADPNLRINGR